MDLSMEFSMDVDDSDRYFAGFWEIWINEDESSIFLVSDKKCFPMLTPPSPTAVSNGAAVSNKGDPPSEVAWEALVISEMC